MQIFMVFSFVLFSTDQVYAANEPFKSTPYPVPRFVSLESAEIYVRTGPGKQYPVKWVFKKQGLPVEVVLEYEHWRKIRDHEGQQGWIYGPLLSGRRTALIRAEGDVLLHGGPSVEYGAVAIAQPMSVVHVKSCADIWCKIEAQNLEGWIPKAFLWGIYDTEKF